MNDNISISNSMKSAFNLWTEHLVKILLVGLIIYFPTQICIELVSLLLDKFISLDDINNINFINNVYNLIRNLIGSIAFLGIINFIILLKSGQKEQSIREILLHGLKKWPSFILAGFIASLKILLFSLLFVIPGIYKAVRLSFLDCVVSTKNKSYSDYCDESEKLVENIWWKIFGFTLLLFLLQFFLELIFIIPFYNHSGSSFVSIFLGVIISLFETYFIVVRADYFYCITKNKEILIDNVTPDKQCITSVGSQSDSISETETFS